MMPTFLLAKNKLRCGCSKSAHGQASTDGAAIRAAGMCAMTRVVLSAQGVSLEERTAVAGETPLTLAVKAGLVHNVKSLQEHGALPDRKSVV